MLHRFLRILSEFLEWVHAPFLEFRPLNELNSAQGLVPVDRRKRLQAFATGADFNWLISNGMTSGIHSN